MLALLVGLAVMVGVAVGLRTLTLPLGALDLRVVRAVSAHRVPAATTVAHELSLLGRDWVVIPVAVLCDVALHVGRRARWSATLAVVLAIVAQNVVKAVVDRPRPPVHHLERVTSSSFPSGHATESLALLVSVGLLWSGQIRSRVTRWGLAGALALVTLAVGCSRVYLGVHYPTDVLVGWLLGLACVATARWSRGGWCRSSMRRR